MLTDYQLLMQSCGYTVPEIIPPRQIRQMTYSPLLGFTHSCGMLHSREKCKKGYVYLLKDGGNNYKVGQTTVQTPNFRGVKGRLSDYNKNNATKMILFCAIKTSCSPGLERYIHALYKDYRLHNEIFQLPDRALDEILSMKSHDNKPVSVHLFTPC